MERETTFQNEIKPPINIADVLPRFCFALEREQINSFVKMSNKHGNNGGGAQSGRKPTRWKEVKFLENATKEECLNVFGCWLNESGWRIVNWDNGEIVADSGSRF